MSIAYRTGNTYRNGFLYRGFNASVLAEDAVVEILDSVPAHQVLGTDPWSVGMNHHNHPRDSKKKYRALIATTLDPTADGAPSFKLVAEGTAPGTTGYTDGAWEGTWRKINGQIWAISPSVSGTGNGGQLTGDAGTIYVLWVKWSLSSGTEIPAEKACTITIT